MVGKLTFEKVSKYYGSQLVLDNVSFEVQERSFFSILGPSGCGKTTLLRLAAGLERPDQGRILLDGEDITNLPPNKRCVNTVFQNYALFPHLTLYENIAFGPTVAKWPRKEIEKETEKMLHLIQMEEQAHKKPHEISGGQKQRVAIARALINRPKVLLLDEPLAALDLKLRQKMLFEIDLIHDEVGITFLFVTHDQVEAMTVSDQIAVLHHGQVEQIATPMQLYEAPKSSFVAAFIGDTNFFDGKVVEEVSQDYSKVDVPGFYPILCFNDKAIKKRGAVHLSIRPEKIHISKEEPTKDPYRNIFTGIVEDVVYKGDHTQFWVRTNEMKINISKQHHRFLLDETPITWKEKVWYWWHADDGYILEKWEAQDELMVGGPPDTIGEEEEGV